MTGFVCDLDHDALPFRYCATKGCTWTDAATPPLVAALPVPPVVPDSEPQMDALPVCAICKGRLDDGHHPYCAIVLDGLSSHVAVPAVTDDEAAVKVVRATVEEMWQESPREIANVVVADLRSAGFLIVHHTKEN